MSRTCPRCGSFVYDDPDEGGRFRTRHCISGHLLSYITPDGHTEEAAIPPTMQPSDDDSYQLADWLRRLMAQGEA